MHLSACVWTGDSADPRYRFPMADQAAYDELVDGVVAFGILRVGNVVLPATSFVRLELIPGP